MERNLEQELLASIRSAMAKAVGELLSGYSSPLGKVVEGVVVGRTAEMRKIIDDAMSTALADAEFAAEIRAAIRQRVARTLIERFGGEVEKRVNELKADPATRAKITLAITQIADAH